MTLPCTDGMAFISIVTNSPPQENPSFLAISSVVRSSFAATGEPAVRTRTAISAVRIFELGFGIGPFSQSSS